jgi:3-deoxy-D-manno-octulosonate 8-phosphate phosphatase (KDO 8-P phosphatase)
VGIITGEDTQIVKRRAEKVKIDFLLQGVKDKYAAVTHLCRELNISLDEVAYIGDDVNDLRLLQAVGISATPANASIYIKSRVQHVLAAKGGEGAFREFVEWIILEACGEQFLTDMYLTF